MLFSIHAHMQRFLVFWYLYQGENKLLFHDQEPKVLREWNALWLPIWGVLPGSRILGDKVIDVLGEECCRKGARCIREALGYLSHTSHFTGFPSIFSYHDQTRGGKISNASKIIRAFQICHFLIFWKDSQVELAQELFTTVYVLHTTVAALFHLSVIWEICVIHPTFQMRK